MREWRNWTGDHVARPVRTLVPRDAAEVAAAVRDAARDGLPVRMAGTGHSFTPAAVTGGVLLRPERLTGVLGLTGDSVTVRAGTRLRDLSRHLATHGLALENLGDIDLQTVAGAISTGTHGTGLAYGGLAGQVTGLELVLADGTVTAAAGDLLAAASVGLGAYGVITAVTLRCVPAFALRAEETAETLGDLLGRWDTLPGEADHVEFYWWPHTRNCQLKRNARVPLSERDPLPRWKALVDDELMANAVFGVVCRAGARVPALVPPVNRVATRLLGERTYTDLSWKVFAHPRRVRFREAEWAIPRAALPDALRALDAEIRRRGWRVSFPVEVRVAAADDRWLSTAYGRETAYLAAHRYVREPHEDYLAAVGDVVRDVAGDAARPHWASCTTSPRPTSRRGTRGSPRRSGCATGWTRRAGSPTRTRPGCSARSGPAGTAGPRGGDGGREPIARAGCSGGTVGPPGDGAPGAGAVRAAGCPVGHSFPGPIDPRRRGRPGSGSPDPEGGRCSRSAPTAARS